MVRKYLRIGALLTAISLGVIGCRVENTKPNTDLLDGQRVNSIVPSILKNPEAFVNRFANKEVISVEGYGSNTDEHIVFNFNRGSYSLAIELANRSPIHIVKDNGQFIVYIDGNSQRFSNWQDIVSSIRIPEFSVENTYLSLENEGKIETLKLNEQISDRELILELEGFLSCSTMFSALDDNGAETYNQSFFLKVGDEILTSYTVISTSGEVTLESDNELNGITTQELSNLCN